LHIESLAFKRGADHGPDMGLVIHGQNPRRSAQSSGCEDSRIRARDWYSLRRSKSCQVQSQVQVLR
jgi:hypothetical protein